MTSGLLRSLEPGQAIVFGGDRVTTVGPDLAAAFRPGDHLVVVQETGALLHVPHDVQALATATVDAAVGAFMALAACSDVQITTFFDRFAALLDDDAAFAPIRAANDVDVERARDRGRSTTRLALSEAMRADMIAGLRTWRDAPASRGEVARTVSHHGWSLDAVRAPLGVVGFVFEGRPNVFADAAGVVRNGNTVVFRIGSDALGTAKAIVTHALGPARADSGLPPSTVSLLPSAARSAGWAMFSDRRLALAVARGSGAAVAQLGAVARQSGIAVSLHGTGGAWLVAGATADADRFRAAVVNSLDRKVCNTLNVCCIPEQRAADLVPVFVDAVLDAGQRRETTARLHVDPMAMKWLDPDLLDRHVEVQRADGPHVEPLASELARDDLGTEWEWESSPEVSLVVTSDASEAVALCNSLSPRFVASLVSSDAAEQSWFFDAVDAPFVGDGFTRWVDGQYALDTPELGLSNWQAGRLLGRGAILSGDVVHTLRYRASIRDDSLRR